MVEAGEQCDAGLDNDDHAACTTSCQLAVCGDGEVWDTDGGDELCDQGADNGPGKLCTATCQLNVCGDGDRGPDEQCDDGDQDPGDGCSATCQLEANFQCTGAPSVCVPFETSCGDGLDNDGDTLVDDADDDCIVTLKFPPCAAGRGQAVLSRQAVSW